MYDVIVVDKGSNVFLIDCRLALYVMALVAPSVPGLL